MRQLWRTLIYEFNARVRGVTPRGDCVVCGHPWHGNVSIGGGEEALVPAGHHVMIPSYPCKTCTHNGQADKQRSAKSFLLRNQTTLYEWDGGAEVELWAKGTGNE